MSEVPSESEAGRAYWQMLLADVSPLDLPVDRQRHKLSQNEWLRVRRPLGHEVASGLRQAGNAIIPIVACTCIALQRHTGHADFPIGVFLGDVAQKIPYLLRLSMNPECRFSTLLTELETKLTSAIANQHELSAQPTDIYPEFLDLFQVVIASGSLPEEQISGCDMYLLLAEDKEEFTLTIEYRSLRIERVTAQRFLEHCAALLVGALNQQEARIADLKMCGKRLEENAPIWQLRMPAGYIPPPPPQAGETLMQRFRQVAALLGDRLALEDSANRYSYKKLDQMTDALGQYLHTHHTCERIALLCDHGAAAIIALLSALKAGAAYIPLDPRYPDEKLLSLLSDVSADVLVVDEKHYARAVALSANIRIVLLNETTSSDNFSIHDDPLRLAYLLYTSGSTGRPKAVMQNQKNVLAHALRYASRVGFAPGERVPLLARYTFDAAVMDIFASLLSGASLHVIDPLGQEGGVVATIAQIAPTILHATPTLFRLILRILDSLEAGGKLVSSVRVVVLGGEEVVPSDVKGFYQHFSSNASLVNGLGPTECTLALQYLVTSNDVERANIPVGYPVEGVCIELVDEAGQSAEVFGELVLCSDNVAIGYLNNKQLTTSAFNKSLHGIPQYRTGDIARRLADGSYVYCGRRDRQIKIRGHRVELGEIESFLRSHPTVAEAAVLLDNAAGNRQILAFVTSATTVPAEADELQSYLRRHLPEYMVPAQVAILEAIPLGPTGKLDRSGLMSSLNRTEENFDDAPKTEIERTIAEIWCAVLGVTSAMLHDNFINSGGDSIQLLELFSRLKNKFDIEVSLQNFIRSPTLKFLATNIKPRTESF